MDLERLYSFVSKTFLGYFDTLIGILTLRRWRLLRSGRSELPTLVMASTVPTIGLVSAPAASEETSANSESQLFGYVVLSVIMGMAIGSVRTLKFEATSLLVATIFLSVAWLIYGSVVHVTCRRLGGRADYSDTMALMLRVLATIYVVSSFAALAIYTVKLAIVRLQGGPIAEFIGDDSRVFYYSIHVLLLMVYIPLSIGPLHRLSRRRTVLLAVLPPLLALFGLGMSLLIALPSMIGS